MRIYFNKFTTRFRETIYGNNTNDEIVKNKPMYFFGIVLKGYNKTIVNIVKIGNKNMPIICMFI
jgi:hypothetical protein